MISITNHNYKRIVTYAKEVEAGDLLTTGYATISNTGDLAEFVGATVPAIASETYDIDIEIDGNPNALAVALLDTDDWDEIASKIETALQVATTSTETVAIVDGQIKVTSATSGVGSIVVISAGTVGSAGGDLLDAIDALGADYTVTLDTPVDGTEGQITVRLDTATDQDNFTSFLINSVLVANSAGRIKTNGLEVELNKVSWDEYYVIISDGSVNLADGDMIVFSGFYF